MSVPIIIDALDPRVVRCTYFYIEATEPQPNWTLELGLEEIPILLIGLSAIVVDTLNGGRFSSADEIEKLFNRVESMPGFSVEVSDIWLPTFLFRGNQAGRGAVYRLDRAAFGRAFAQGRDGFNLEVWDSHRPELEFSPEETNAFKAWGQNTIAWAQERFPKNPELKLNRRDPEMGLGNLLPSPEPPPPLLGP